MTKAHDSVESFLLKEDPASQQDVSPGRAAACLPDAPNFVTRFARDNGLPVEVRIQPVFKAEQPGQARRT
ncbi:hypothetical protein [Paraburkholderia hospita]|uniref:hypothetical protein n=1 Tax=Paraburkholderia hospita TaxID=169430 RepID=UPI0009A58569|nr:hypothetical protein [Paraburkholderia hospita]SKD04398.1 hypothetical protein SAMN05446934_9312 [Paraburkholderia hospita]